MFFIYLIIALAAGVALATQSAINTQLAKAMSGEAVIATFISFAVGTIVLFFIAWVKTDLFQRRRCMAIISCFYPNR